MLTSLSQFGQTSDVPVLDGGCEVIALLCLCLALVEEAL